MEPKAPSSVKTNPLKANRQQIQEKITANIDWNVGTEYRVI